jgi:recombination associated protein RdgC
MKPMELIEQGRFLGEEFILWLWWRGLAEGGTSGLEGDTSACFVDDAVTLVTERGDVKALSLAKGNPAESREAFEALSRGFRPGKAKIRLLAGDMEWTFSLAPGDLQLQGLKLPPTQAKDMAGRLADRMFLIEEGLAHLDRRYAAFLALRAQDPQGLQDALQEWVRQGLDGNVGETGIPWEEDGPARLQISGVDPAHPHRDDETTVSMSVNGGEFTPPITMSDFKDKVGAFLQGARAGGEA